MLGVSRSAYLGPKTDAMRPPRAPGPSHVRARSIALTAIAVSVLGCGGRVRPMGVSSSRSADQVEAYDFVEITAKLRPPAPPNPFTGAELRGWFESLDGRFRREIDGFCDSPDGK